MAGEIDHFNSYTFNRPVKANSKANVSRKDERLFQQYE